MFIVNIWYIWYLFAKYPTPAIWLYTDALSLNWLKVRIKARQCSAANIGILCRLSSYGLLPVAGVDIFKGNSLVFKGNSKGLVMSPLYFKGISKILKYEHLSLKDCHEKNF